MNVGFQNFKVKRMVKKVLLATCLSWSFASTLGLMHAACVSGHFSLSTLQLPGVLPVALLGSALAAILVTPMAVWSLRTGARNLCIYGPILWAILAIYVLLISPRSAGYGLYGVLLLAIIGLLVLGLIPASKSD
jgi:hypothetical protein